MKNKMNIHFMGIGGSALSGVSILAKNMGFNVDGCDIESDTSYMNEVRKNNIMVYPNHDVSHLKYIDILAVSPAVLYQNIKHPEYINAKKKGIAVTWDEFVGQYLLTKKEVLCITGTHGKSTTTALSACLFEAAGFDPGAVVGAKVNAWGKNYRVGKSKYFIIEADDFYEKFLNYSPSAIILNNIEFDHPDFFTSEKDMINSYFKFIKLLKGAKILILNQDSEGNLKLMEKLDKKYLNSLRLYGYTFLESPKLKLKNTVKIRILEKKKNGTKFKLISGIREFNDTYFLGIPGEYNVANSVGSIILAKLYGIKTSTIKNVLTNFKSAGRRMELIGEKKGIRIYDDYAHHPTAIKETLKGLRQKYPNDRIWAVIEAHSFSRTKALLNDYRGVFTDADKVLVGPIFKARDTQNFGVNGYSIVKVSKHKDIRFVPTSEQISYKLKRERRKGDVVIVMGAGYSYKWARDIIKTL